MPTRKSPRKGSLQIWPRKRAKKFLPRVNWNAIDSEKPLKGFICYKVGMKSAYVKDSTPNSLTSGKNIVLPVTILECPTMKIFSVRFYKNSKVVSDVISEGLDKELKKKLKLPKKFSKIDSVKPESYDDISIVVYSQVKKTGLKKTPDVIEIGLNGSKEDKLNFVKENLGKEFSVSDFFEVNQLVDFRGVSIGRGFQGPVKRFGITLKVKKSEKGQRRPGSIGPWNPSRVTFRVPMAGQTGFHTRVVYNKKVVDVVNGKEKPLKNMKNYGDVKNEYLVVTGSVQGPAKRQLIITNALRKTKKQDKKKYEFVELR